MGIEDKDVEAHEVFMRELGREVMGTAFGDTKVEEIDTGLMWRWFQLGWKTANAISDSARSRG